MARDGYGPGVGYCFECREYLPFSRRSCPCCGRRMRYKSRSRRARDARQAAHSV